MLESAADNLPGKIYSYLDRGKVKESRKVIFLGCTFETVRFVVLVAGKGVSRPGKGGAIPGKWEEIPLLGRGNRQENLGCCLAGNLPKVCLRVSDRSLEYSDWLYKVNWGTTVI